MVYYKKLWVFTFLIVVLSCKKEIPSITPQILDITESVYASGIIKSKNQYSVYATSSGIVTKIFVEVGDVVKKGEPLIKIQNQSAVLNSQNALLSAQYNEYSRNSEKVQQIRQEIEIAKRKVKSDSILMKRQDNLWSQGIGTKVEQEQRVLTYETAKSNLDNLNLKLNDLTKQLKFLAAQSKNNLQISQAQLKDYIIKSEIDGRVYAFYQEVGEMVGPTVQLGVIGDASDFNIELQMDEYDIIKIKAQQEVIVRLDSYDNEVFQARIEKINPIMNTKTRTFTVDASFVKKPEVLYPNLSLEANIVINKKSQVLTVPVSYISQEKFVLLKDGTRKEVSVGLRDYQKAEILSGLDKDSEIIPQ